MKIRTVMLALLTMLMFQSSVIAHGLGKQQLERVEAGPYLISAWTDPTNVDTNDELHVTVGIEDDEGLVLNADVQVQAIFQADTGKIERAKATHDNAVNKLHYEAPLDLREAGKWEITITVEDDSGSGEASFILDIEEAQNDFPWRWIGLVLIGTMLIALVLVSRVRMAKENQS